MDLGLEYSIDMWISTSTTPHVMWISSTAFYPKMAFLNADKSNGLGFAMWGKIVKYEWSHCWGQGPFSS